MTTFAQVYMISFTGAVFVAFLAAMLFSGGRAAMNTYGEGWLEVCMAFGAVVFAVSAVRS